MHDIATPAAPTKFLSFALGGLEYGLDVAPVQELCVLKALERFASAGAVLGNVAVSRGVVMPLVDMRAACGGNPEAPHPMNDVIVLKLSHCTMGMVVDGVTGVVTLAPGQVAPLASAEEAAYLIGTAQVGTRRLILVDIERLMSVRRGDGARQVA
jgi:purine-binding chemotaxis protein CheW